MRQADRHVDRQKERHVYGLTLTSLKGFIAKLYPGVAFASMDVGCGGG